MTFNSDYIGLNAADKASKIEAIIKSQAANLILDLDNLNEVDRSDWAQIFDHVISTQGGMEINGKSIQPPEELSSLSNEDICIWLQQAQYAISFSVSQSLDLAVEKSPAPINIIRHIVIDGADQMIVLNGQIILTSDTGPLDDTVSRLKSALSASVIVINEVFTPPDGNWTYDDALANLGEPEVIIIPTQPIDDWFANTNDAKAFLINGQCSSDFSYPSPDDDGDTCYSFYIYGPQGVTTEIFLSPDDAESFKLINEREIVISTNSGETYSIQALS